jgi:hypothetical protein
MLVCIPRSDKQQLDEAVRLLPVAIPSPCVRLPVVHFRQLAELPALVAAPRRRCLLIFPGLSLAAAACNLADCCPCLRTRTAPAAAGAWLGGGRRDRRVGYKVQLSGSHMQLARQDSFGCHPRAPAAEQQRLSC